MRCGCIDRINKSQSGHNTRLAFLPDLWVRTARSNYASFCANPFLPESNSTLPCSAEYQHPHCRGRESHVFAPHSQLTFLARTNDTLSRSYLSLPSTKGWWTGRSRQGYTSFLVDSQWLDPLLTISSPHQVSLIGITHSVIQTNRGNWSEIHIIYCLLAQR